MNITEKALQKLKEFRPNESDVLIVGVQGAGCSGYRFTMKFQSYKIPYDKQIVSGSPVDLVLVGTDSRSALFLDGVTLDYSDGLEGKGFEWQKPDAKFCGCGESFR
jgi:iron-sulfur cluster assembly protein